jgi:hypothetical protein
VNVNGHILSTEKSTRRRFAIAGRQRMIQVSSLLPDAVSSDMDLLNSFYGSYYSSVRRNAQSDDMQLSYTRSLTLKKIRHLTYQTIIPRFLTLVAGFPHISYAVIVCIFIFLPGVGKPKHYSICYLPSVIH